MCKFNKSIKCLSPFSFNLNIKFCSLIPLHWEQTKVYIICIYYIHRKINCQYYIHSIDASIIMLFQEIYNSTTSRTQTFLIYKVVTANSN